MDYEAFKSSMNEWATFACLALVSQRQKSRWMISGLAFILSLDIAPKSSIEEQVQSPLLQGELQSLRAKNTASLRRIKIAHRNNTQLYLCQTTISRYNLQIRGGIHQISTQQQTRTTYANEIKKAHALAQPAPQNIQPSPRSSYLARVKKNTIDTLGCPKALAGNQAAGNRVL